MASVSGVGAGANTVKPTAIDQTTTANQPKKAKKHHGHHHGPKHTTNTANTTQTPTSKTSSVGLPGGTLDTTA